MSEVQGYVETATQAAREGQLSESSAANITRWLTEPGFVEFRPRLIEDIEARRWQVLDDVYFKVLEFGTGGRRGRMYPVGTNVLNRRTIAESARGLADHILSKPESVAARSCVIAHDTRHNSVAFARTCAEVLAAAGFQVALLDGYRSTPLLSFAVRQLGSGCGIMITASHNPPSDNGFKCYAATGGQVVPPDDKAIIARVQEVMDREIPTTPYEAGLASGAIRIVGEEIDRAYLEAVVAQAVSEARDLKLVYTPMHGVGETNVAAALRLAGFAHVDVLSTQRTPDGDFPNIPGHVANPEIPKTLEASILEARATGAELVLASDPDADRIGVAVPVAGDPKGDWTTLNGNQIGVVQAAFVLEKLKAKGAMPASPYIVTTLVSSQMPGALARRAGVEVEDQLLVGFKWIAVQIDARGPEGFLFAFEESHGYLRGAHVRDKDAAVASLLMAELCADLKVRGTTLIDYLDQLYLDVGHYGERLINKVLEGRKGVEQIQALMAAFRDQAPTELAGQAVLRVDDYKRHETRTLDGSAATTPLPEPSGDLLMFYLSAPGTRFAVRPSGTEPKLKIYLFARTETQGRSLEDLPAIKAETDQTLERLTNDINAYMDKVLAETP